MRRFPSVVIPHDNPLSIAEQVADRAQDLAVEMGESWLYKYLNRFVILPKERTIWRGEFLWRRAKRGEATLIGHYLPDVAAKDVMDDVSEVLNEKVE